MSFVVHLNDSPSPGWHLLFPVDIEVVGHVGFQVVLNKHHACTRGHNFGIGVGEHVVLDEHMWPCD